MQHLKRFQAIADANGDQRASGYPGHEASAKYVAAQLKKAGWVVSTPRFDFPSFTELEPTVFEQLTPEQVTYENGVDFAIMEYSDTGDVQGTLQAVDIMLPPGAEPSSSSSGCEPEDFSGFTAGNIALMQRGTCDFAVKVQNAEDAGAIGAIIFNEGQEGRQDLLQGTLGAESAATIPAIGTTFALGEELAQLAGQGATFHIVTSTLEEVLSTTNVIAETKFGNANNVVMAGGHLDSVKEGPGINDNGSGSAALIQIAKKISDLGIKTRNKLRFAWWGAEESGLLGAYDYVEGLSEAELGRINSYLNFDMIASPNFARFIYDGNGSAFPEVGGGPDGSGAIERAFQNYFSSRGLTASSTAFDGRSDYEPFMLSDIPSGGLFTGAEDTKTEQEALLFGGTVGEQFDPCYHAACDDIDNINRRVFGQMADAIAHVVLQLGNRAGELTGKRG